MDGIFFCGGRDFLVEFPPRGITLCLSFSIFRMSNDKLYSAVDCLLLQACIPLALPRGSCSHIKLRFVEGLEVLNNVALSMQMQIGSIDLSPIQKRRYIIGMVNCLLIEMLQSIALYNHLPSVLVLTSLCRSTAYVTEVFDLEQATNSIDQRCSSDPPPFHGNGPQGFHVWPLLIHTIRALH
jgi:hypothetical protein